MKKSDQKRCMAAVGLYCPKRLLKTEANQRTNRRMYLMCISSLIAILTCITMTVSTTWAWFYANLRTKENTIQIASFRASANLNLTSSIDATVIVMDADTVVQQATQAMPLSSTFSLRTPMIVEAEAEGESGEPADRILTEEELVHALELPEGAYAAGTYDMNISYSGTTGGYCTFTVMPASDWSATAESATYYVALPSTNGADAVVSISLTLNEPAYVEMETNWGAPGTAVEYVDSDGVSFGEVLVLKVLGSASAPGDTVYGVEDDTAIIPGIIVPTEPDDTVYDVEDDTTIIPDITVPAEPVIPDDDEDEDDDTPAESDEPDAPAEDKEDDPVYDVEDDTVIIPSVTAPDSGEDTDEPQPDDTVYSISDDTVIIRLTRE